MDRFINKIKGEMFVNQYGIHGINHTKRVLILLDKIIQIEGLTLRDSNILGYAGLYHDIGRINDNIDMIHGIRSYKRLTHKGLLNEIQELNAEDTKILKFIIEQHSFKDENAKININDYDIIEKDRALKLYEIFKDADGLDRVRIGDLDIKYLRRESVKTLVKVAEELFKKIPNDYDISYVLLDSLKSYIRDINKNKLEEEPEMLIKSDSFDESLREHLKSLKEKELYDIEFHNDYISANNGEQELKIYLPGKHPKEMYHATSIKKAVSIINDGYLRANRTSEKYDIEYNKVFVSQDITYGRFLLGDEYIALKVDTSKYKIYHWMDNIEWFIYGDIDIKDIELFYCKDYGNTYIVIATPITKEDLIKRYSKKPEEQLNEDHPIKTEEYTISSILDELKKGIELLTQTVKEYKFS